MRAPENWCARGVCKRAVCEPLQRRAVVLTASLCGSSKRYAKMRLHRPSAAAAAREPHACALLARARKLARAWSAQ
eukprot:9428852-Lingulodinium_polyedra.AAC.1